MKIKLKSIRLLGTTLLAAAFMVTGAIAQDEDQPNRIMFTNVNVFDGVSETLDMNTSVLVEDNLIKSIGSSIALPEGVEVIDGGGRTLMPGLIDSHVHLLYSSTPDSIPGREAMRWDQLAAIGVVSAHEFLADGFTTVRDAGAMYDGIKKVIDQGLLEGPRIYPSGGVLSQTSGHADWRAVSQRQPTIAGVQDNNLGRLGLMHLVDGVDEVIRATRQNLSQGATQIKMTTGGGISSTLDPLHTKQFFPEEIEAAVRAAADWDTYVLVHAYTDETVIRSLEAGVQCIDHGQMMSEKAMQLLVEKEAFLVPNMAAMSPEILDHPVYGQGVFAVKTRAFLDGSNEFVDLVNKYNPKVAYGTDVVATEPVTTRAFRDNNMWMHANSFGNLNALRALTSVAGELMALTGKHNPYPNKLGVIEPGAYADILLVDGNPLEDIAVLGAYPTVFDAPPRDAGIGTMPLIMKDGKIYKNKNTL